LVLVSALSIASTEASQRFSRMQTEMFQLNDAGLTAITIGIASASEWQDADSPPSTKLEIRGVSRGEQVGFDLLVPKEWEALDQNGRPYGLWSSTVVLASVGPSSDRFVRSLAEHFGVPNLGRPFRDFVVADAIALNTDPSSLLSTPLSLKLIFLNEEGEPIAEAYLHIDAKNGSARFEEKNSEYRAGIVTALSAEDQ
jgi:hypothetical protein